jgi:hypothetical protein
MRQPHAGCPFQIDTKGFREVKSQDAPSADNVHHPTYDERHMRWATSKVPVEEANK